MNSGFQDPDLCFRILNLLLYIIILLYVNVTLHLMFTVNWKYYGVAVPSEYNITKYVFINIIKSQYILGSLQCK